MMRSLEYLCLHSCLVLRLMLFVRLLRLRMIPPSLLRRLCRNLMSFLSMKSVFLMMNPVISPLFLPLVMLLLLVICGLLALWLPPLAQFLLDVTVLVDSF